MEREYTRTVAEKEGRKGDWYRVGMKVWAIGRMRVRKYRDTNPEEVCRSS
ncbi:MAG: hypothetical protein ACRCSI_09010 [Eubacterium aggregans]